VNALVDRLTPVVQARIGRALVAWARGHGRDRIREEVADMTQDVLAALFASDGRLLRSWDVQKGLSLENFAGLVARRYALSALRTNKRNPFTEDATLESEFDELNLEAPSHEGAVMSRDLLRQVFGSLDAKLSPLGRTLFQALFIDQLEVSELMLQTGLSRDAVYAWRSRLTKLLRLEYRGAESALRDSSPSAPPPSSPPPSSTGRAEA
jgi:RNA polymerase sigma factor (sigma-70 family)